MTNTAPVAWMHPDGRILPAKTVLHARTSGGASLSAVIEYTIPLYDHRANERDTASLRRQLDMADTMYRLVVRERDYERARNRLMRVALDAIKMGTPPPSTGANEEATMQEYEVEQQVQHKGLTAPRITPSHIDKQIVGEDYHVFPGTTVTVCCLHLRNGFTVVGESACASAENFNAELGSQIAKSNARHKIWALEGYLLRQHLAEQEARGVGE